MLWTVDFKVRILSILDLLETCLRNFKSTVCFYCDFCLLKQPCKNYCTLAHFNFKGMSELFNETIELPASHMVCFSFSTKIACSTMKTPPVCEIFHVSTQHMYRNINLININHAVGDIS